MSTKQLFRGGLMATAGVAALGLTACANSHATSARYGGTHYDYESAQSCGGNCGIATVSAPAIRTAPVYSGTHYDYESSHTCNTGTCGVGVVSHSGYAQTGYTAAPSYSTEVAPCPAGTTSQPDGTCMQTGGSHYTGYSSGSTSYTTGSTAYTGSAYGGSSYSSGGMAECPAGTSAQPDGTCLQSGHGYSSYSSSTAYTAPTTSTYSSTYVAPALTTECCTVGSTAIYSGDATTETYSDTTTADAYTGYATSGSTYSSSDYLPIRK